MTTIFLPSGVLPRMESTTSTRRLVPMALMPMQTMSMDQTFRYWLLSMYHLKPPMPGIRRSTTFANRITNHSCAENSGNEGGDLVQSGLQFFHSTNSFSSAIQIKMQRDEGHAPSSLCFGFIQGFLVSDLSGLLSMPSADPAGRRRYQRCRSGLFSVAAANGASSGLLIFMPFSSRAETRSLVCCSFSSRS